MIRGVSPFGSAASLDVIYPVRPGDSNEELRFSLRSLAVNLPHGRVFIVGYKPGWVTGVEYIPGGNSAPHPRANLYRNLMLACRYPDVSDDVLIMNDDFFVIGHVDRVPVLHRGASLAKQVALLTKRAGRRGWWQESLNATLACLQAAGHPDPISYELHVPFPVNRHAMADTLEQFADVTRHNPPQWRTLYGNVHSIGGAAHEDCKALRPGPICRPYHSTDDMSWRYFRSRFVEMFPQPGRYELAGADARSLVSVSPRQHLRAVRRTRA